MVENCLHKKWTALTLTNWNESGLDKKKWKHKFIETSMTLCPNFQSFKEFARLVYSAILIWEFMNKIEVILCLLVWNIIILLLQCHNWIFSPSKIPMFIVHLQKFQISFLKAIFSTLTTSEFEFDPFACLLGLPDGWWVDY